MKNVLHIYDNKPFASMREKILPDSLMGYYPIDIMDISPDVLRIKEFSLIIFDTSGRDSSSIIIFDQLVKWIEISGNSRPPVIVLSEQDSQFSEQSARIAGADFFFLKPVSKEQITTVLTQIESPA